MMAWMSVEQVAERFAVSQETVREWCKAGKIRAEKAGGQWWFDGAYVMSWVKPKSEIMGRPRSVAKVPFSLVAHAMDNLKPCERRLYMDGK